MRSFTILSAGWCQTPFFVSPHPLQGCTGTHQARQRLV